MNKTIKLPVKRCLHGLIKKWCVDCAGDSKSKKVAKMLTPKQPKKRHVNRKADGKYDYSLKSKALNAIFILTGTFLIAYSGLHLIRGSREPATFVSPVSAQYGPPYMPSPTPTPTVDPIEQEIKEVFGQYSDQAIKIAKCESGMKEKATNDNTTWGGIGRDKGPFQINDVYHPAADKFLYDYKVNVAMAYKIFRDAGNTFRPWVCRWVLD